MPLGFKGKLSTYLAKKHQPLVIRPSKEGINAYPFISQEFKELLAEYLPHIDRDNKYLPQIKRKGRVDEETLNWTLNNPATRANLKIRDKLHWHLGRKLVMRTSAQLGINQWNCKMFVGRAVPKDVEIYISGINLKSDFEKLHEVLILIPYMGKQRKSWRFKIGYQRA